MTDQDYPFYTEIGVRGEQGLRRWFVSNLALDGTDCCKSQDAEILYWCPGVFYVHCRKCNQVTRHDYNIGCSEPVDCLFSELKRIASSDF